MDKEIVFGNKICVNFRTRAAIELSYSPPRDYVRDFISSPDSSVTHSPCSSRDSSPSPPPSDLVSQAKISNYMCNAASEKKFVFPPPPVINDQDLLWRGKPQNCIDNSKSFPDNSDLPKGKKVAPMGWNNVKAFCQTNEKYQDSAFLPFRKDLDPDLKKCPQRNVGRVAPYVASECDSKAVPLGHLNQYQSNNRRNPTASNAYPPYSGQSLFPYPQSIPGNDRIGDPVACTSQWGGTGGLHGDLQPTSRSSLATDMTAPVELHVSNLDSKFEINEMKKILLSVFSEHVMVRYW